MMLTVIALFVGPPIVTIPAWAFAGGFVFCLGMVGVLWRMKGRRP